MIVTVIACTGTVSIGPLLYYIIRGCCSVMSHVTRLVHFNFLPLLNMGPSDQVSHFFICLLIGLCTGRCAGISSDMMQHTNMVHCDSSFPHSSSSVHRPKNPKLCHSGIPVYNACCCSMTCNGATHGAKNCTGGE